MYKNTKQGWYKLVQPQKFIAPIDEHMKSYNDGFVNYKSSLELKAFKYADYNKHIVNWSVEPFAIKYIKPTDGRYHRYYIDLVLQFSSGDKFLVEIKSYSQTIPPKKPKNKTQKSLLNYNKATQTYHINQCKWNAAKQFAKENGFRFIILTENELN